MFTGSLVALATPFKNGQVDVERLEDLVQFHIDAGTHGIVPCGTTGESATLDHAEHELVIETVASKAAGRIPVLAGTGSNSTAEAVRLTRFAKEVGADGALVITPYYNRPTQEGLYAHFSHIAESVDLPLVLYNVPGRTAVDLMPETVARLSRLANVVAIKEATGSIDRSVEILQSADIDVLSGDDSLTIPLMVLGARGVISVAANIVPKQIVDLVDLAKDGDYAGARELHLRLFPLFKSLFIETNPIPVKAAMALSGLCGPELRLPLGPASEATARELEARLRELEVLA